MKKLLALVLALVMTLGLATVGASATTFSDDADIDHQEAVEVMNALNIINGMGDGKFDPNGNVTRAQMAKMVTIALLGDVEVSAFTGTATDLKDVGGHWAEGYIKYCYSQGIISGRGNGIFDPNANVTTAEASKMLLVALGYNSDVRKYTGDQWAINVARDAQQKGMYKDIANLTSGKAMDRDDAAQLIYNTLTATRVERTESYDSEGVLRITYGDAPTNTAAQIAVSTLLGKTFDGAKKYGYLTTVSYNTDKGLYSYTIDSRPFHGAPVIGTNDDGFAATNATTGGSAIVTSEVDYSELLGQRVAIVYKDLKTVYGIYSDAEVLATTYLGNIKNTSGNTLADAAATSVKFDSTTVNLDSGLTAGTIDYIGNLNSAVTGKLYNSAATDLVGANAGAQVATRPYSMASAIDNDADGKADVIVLYQDNAAKVTYVGSTSITAGNISYSYSTTDKNWSYTTGGVTTHYNFPEGLKKGDYVLIPALKTGATDYIVRDVTKIDAIEGKVTGRKTSSAQIEGSWYDEAVITAGDLALNSTYKVWAVNGYVVGFDTVTAGSKDIAMLIAFEDATSLSGIKAKVLFADGTVNTIEISKVENQAVDDSTGGHYQLDDADNDFGSTAKFTGITGGINLFTYEKKTDGTYAIEQIDGDTLAGFDSYAAGVNTSYTKAQTNVAPHIATNTPIYDDGLFFVAYDTNNTTKYTVVTGAQLKTYGNLTSANTHQVLYKNVNGVPYAAVAVINSTATAFGTNTMFGYVTAAGYTVSDNGTKQVYTVWTEDGSKTVTDTYTSTLYAKGAVIQMTENSDGTVTSTGVLGNRVAVTGYSENDKQITLLKNDGTYLGAGEINSIATDTKILYVNGKDKVGVEGGAIETAQEDANGGYLANAWAIYNNNSSGIIDLIVVDTANKWLDADNVHGYAVTLPAAGSEFTTDTGTISTAHGTVTWTVNGHTVAAGTTAHATAGQKIVATVTLSDAAADAITIDKGIVFTGLVVDTVTPVAAVTTQPKFYNNATIAAGNLVAADQLVAGSGTNILELNNKASSAAIRMVGGVLTFTWTVVDEDLAPTIGFDAVA